jgi:hypothetical protein
MTVIGSCTLIVAVIVGRDRRPEEPAAAKFPLFVHCLLLSIDVTSSHPFHHYGQVLAYEGRAQFPHSKGKGCQSGLHLVLTCFLLNSSVLFAYKFSVDDFEAAGTTPWEGVRNPEARNIMKEMQVGDKVGFAFVDCPNNSCQLVFLRFCFITRVAMFQVRASMLVEEIHGLDTF